MKTEYHKWWSHNLNQDMELKVYGHAGRPVMAFPTSGGRFYEFEDVGMIEACRAFIEQGVLTFFTVDSIDDQSWYNAAAHPADRAKRHNDYDRYLIHEVLPLVHAMRQNQGHLLTTGCSLGAFHAANFFFRHPDVCDALIGLSGLYSLTFSVGDYMDDNIYFNSPLNYLAALDDPWFLDRYRRSRIVLCAGQGAWEEEVFEETRRLRDILFNKGIPCWMDIWGKDVSHDWPWWRKQLPYFLTNL